MANKDKTIKNATDKELDELLFRLRKENEAQNIIRNIIISSTPTDYSYDNVKVSTEEPIGSMYHFGKLGMHWGRRTGSGKIKPNKNKQPSKKEDNSEDSITKNRLKNKKLNQMTNSEIRTLNDRLQLERQYKDLTKTDISPGKKFVTEILTNAAKQTVSSYASKYMSKGVEALLKKATRV